MITVSGPLEWGMKELPDFASRKVLILGGAFFGSVVSLFAECNFKTAKTVEEADLIVFVGGSDVDPSLYGQKKLPLTHSSPGRDEFERSVYERAQQLKKPCYGICRGAQLLHVLNGGQLWQHVDSHGGRDHIIYDLEENVYVLANSYHHQMLIDNEKLRILAVCKDQVSKYFATDAITINLNKGKDHEMEMEIEAGSYKDTRCLFVQGHPEVGSPEYRSWCMAHLYDFILECEKEEKDDLPNEITGNKMKIA